MNRSIRGLVYCIFWLSLLGCSPNKTDQVIKFATSADYPPFEYHKNGKLTGFEIELAELIAKKLHKKASFENMEFSSILAAVQSGLADAAIAAIAITAKRSKNFAFSESYCKENLAMVYLAHSPLKTQAQLAQKRIACQLGTAMELWLKTHARKAKLTLTNGNGQALTALKSRYVDGVFMGSIQAARVVKHNPNLAYSIIAQSDQGYAILVPKGSRLKEEFNQALKLLQSSGELEQLQNKWLKQELWSN